MKSLAILACGLIAAVLLPWARAQDLEAEKLFREALAGYQASMPADSPLIFFTQIRLAICLTSQGQLEEAEKLLQAGLAGYEARRPIVPPRLAGAAFLSS